jgi:hypothetical protein
MCTATASAAAVATVAAQPQLAQVGSCWLQVLIDELELHGQISPEEFIKQREEQLDKLFPTAQLMSGEGGLST